MIRGSNPYSIISHFKYFYDVRMVWTFEISKAAHLWLVILVSWGIAHYLNIVFRSLRTESGMVVYNAAQLKTIQEVITLDCF